MSTIIQLAWIVTKKIKAMNTKMEPFIVGENIWMTEINCVTQHYINQRLFDILKVWKYLVYLAFKSIITFYNQNNRVIIKLFSQQWELPSFSSCQCHQCHQTELLLPSFSSFLLTSRLQPLLELHQHYNIHPDKNNI